MKKQLIAFIAGATLMGATSAMATTYSFSTSKTAVKSMDHATSIVWNLQQAINAGDSITSATLTIEDLYNWRNSADDKLYVNLINTSSKPNTLTKYSNDPSDTSNYFSGNGFNGIGTLLTTVNGGEYNSAAVHDLVYTFTDLSVLKTDLADGFFGFGFDPDCHWYDSGMTFTFTTAAPVPEPGTMMLLGIGMLGMAVYGKRRMNKEA